jgi:hypothetical protein
VYDWSINTRTISNPKRRLQSLPHVTVSEFYSCAVRYALCSYTQQIGNAASTPCWFSCYSDDDDEDDDNNNDDDGHLLVVHLTTR